MKELFTFATFGKEEREILNSISLLLDNAVARELTYSPRQIHYSLIRNNVINGKDLPFSAFYRLLRKGLFSGNLDWYGICYRTGTNNTIFHQSTEIYIRGAYLDNWLEKLYDSQQFSITHTAGLAWNPCVLRDTAHRASYFVSRNHLYHIDYISDDFDSAPHMYQKFCKTVRRLVQVISARDFFNHEGHGASWDLGGISTSDTKSYNTLRRYASNALATAKRRVDNNLIITNLGLKRGSKYAKDAHHGRLASLPVNTLMAMLYNAPHRISVQ